MRIFWALCLALTPTLGTAQEVLGQSMIDGRDITIYADGTWEFAARGTDACDLIARGVEFCGEAIGWETTTPPNNDIAATYRFDDRHYGQMIIEELGENEGLTADLMRGIVIDNAAAVLGTTAKDINVIETYRSRVSGQSIETIVYAFSIDGLDVVYANGIRTAPNRTMQLMTYSIGTTYTDRHRDLHEDFLSEIRIGK